VQREEEGGKRKKKSKQVTETKNNNFAKLKSRGEQGRTNGVGRLKATKGRVKFELTKETTRGGTIWKKTKRGKGGGKRWGRRTRKHKNMMERNYLLIKKRGTEALTANGERGDREEGDKTGKKKKEGKKQAEKKRHPQIQANH